jgi:hypothetical protein
MTMRLVTPILLAATVLTATAENRPMDNYRSIIDRNPFGLKPVQPPIQTPIVSPPPPAKKVEFYLTGISSIGFPRTPKTVYLVNKDNSKKDYKDKFYKLRLNEPQGDVSLEDIDEKNRRVKIKASGDEMWLSMKENSIPSGSMPPPMAGMPQPAFVPGQSPSPGAVPIPLPGGGAMPNPNMPAAQPTFPAVAPSNPTRRIPRSNTGAFNGASAPMMSAPVNQSTAAAQAAYAGQAAYAAQTPSYPQPTVTFGNGGANMQINPAQPSANDAAAAAAADQVPAEEKALRTYINRAADVNAGKVMPPLPSL